MSSSAVRVSTPPSPPRELPAQARWFFLLAPPLLAFVFDPSCLMEPGPVARATLAITGYTVLTGLAVHESFEWLSRRSRAWSLALRVPAHGLLCALVVALVTAPQLPVILWLYPEASGMEVDILVRGLLVSFAYLGGASLVAHLLRRAVRERTRALEARLTVLQAQMQPHFLFNSLNVCAGLVHEDPDAAESTMDELAGFLRYALESAEQRLVPLGDEIAAMRSYLEVQQQRFGDRLVVTFDVTPDCLPFRIPPMTLQPLIENALLHGLRATEDGGTVRVRARVDGARVAIAVEDDGVGPGASTHRGTGTGLRNVSERLELVYGERASLRHGVSDLGGFGVWLSIPRVR